MRSYNSISPKVIVDPITEIKADSNYTITITLQGDNADFP